MTTATTVAGRPLSGWSRDARFGTWHALLPDGSGEPVRGALHIAPALLGPQGTRERLTAAVLATAKLRLPGLLGTVDLVAEADAVWLLTARPPAPTLADILSADGPRPDAGSAASILNETAQTLLSLHTAGLTHGSLAPDTVVLAPDGVALLAEAGLSAVLGDAPAAAVRLPGDLPPPDRRASDTAAWATLARTLGTAWTQAGTPAANLFAHCATTAESEGLATARAALVAGHAALPANFLRRTALRAAAASATPPFPPRTTPRPPAPADATVAPQGSPAPGHEVRTPHPPFAPAGAPASQGSPAPGHEVRTPHPPLAPAGAPASQGSPAPINESRTPHAPADGASAPLRPPTPDHDPRTPHPPSAPADGASAPQGPPAPDHESRTGGAGGNPYPAEGRVWVPHN
ncbi:hypothetical protein ACFW7O_29615, partial [Streptomyces diastatochromogenes]